MLSRPLAYLRASANVSWSCNYFLLTLLDLPFSIMAINISVSNQPVGKSKCSPSALNLEMNESQVSSELFNYIESGSPIESKNKDRCCALSVML